MHRRVTGLHQLDGLYKWCSAQLTLATCGVGLLLVGCFSNLPQQQACQHNENGAHLERGLLIVGNDPFASCCKDDDVIGLYSASGYTAI
jgi:hypothetical protein